VELGVYSFGERTVDPATGYLPSEEERLRRLLEEIELADQVGLDVFGVGEHHRPDFVVSAPVVVLAAAAARTRRIRLTSAVTVLSSDDPVRVFEAFATLDLISGGRAEIMVGRGSFVESFPLFGYDLADYDELFAEKLDLLLRIRESAEVRWQGRLRPPLVDARIHPRPLQDPLPIWVAVGGTPASARRTGALGLPLMLAIIGGAPERFLPFALVHRREATRMGRVPPPFGISAHGYIAPAGVDAVAESFPSVASTMNRIGRERGWRPLTFADYRALCGPGGAYFVGSPETVVEKILRLHEVFGLDRFLLQLSVGTMPHEKVLRAIELFGTEVAPAVRRSLAGVPGGRGRDS
jgi:probable LLM family oxidoreductase